MLKTLMDEEEADQGAWLSAFWKGEWGVDIGGQPGDGPWALQTSDSIWLDPQISEGGS